MTDNTKDIALVVVVTDNTKDIVRTSLKSLQENAEGAWEARYSDGHFYEVLVLERS